MQTLKPENKQESSFLSPTCIPPFLFDDGVHGASKRGAVSEFDVCIICPNHNAAEAVLFQPCAFVFDESDSVEAVFRTGGSIFVFGDKVVSRGW